MESPFIIVFPYIESSSAVHTGHIYTTTVTPFMSDRSDSTIPPNSFSIIEQEIMQGYLNFQSDLLPTRSSYAKAQDSPSNLSSTPHVIHKTYNISCDLTLEFRRSTLYLLVTMSNLANQLPSYESDSIMQDNSNYFCLCLGFTPM